MNLHHETKTGANPEFSKSAEAADPLRLAMITFVSWLLIEPGALRGQEPELKSLEAQAHSVFKKRCVTCHSQSQLRGDLDMTSTQSILAGSASGPVVVPGKPEESSLYLVAAHKEDPKMPPNAPRIAQRELSYIQKWIAAMAPIDAEQMQTAMSKEPTGDIEPPATKQAHRLVDDSGLVPLKPLPRKTATVAIAASPSGDLAAVSSLGQVALLDLKQWKWLGALAFPEGEILATKFSGDGKVLYASGGIQGASGSIVGWDMATHRRVMSVSLPGDAVMTFDVSPDNKMIVAGGPTRTVYLIEVEASRIQSELRKHTDWITSIAFSHDGLLFASGDRFGAISVWKTNSAEEFMTLTGHSSRVTSMIWSEDDNRIVTSSIDGRVQSHSLVDASQSQGWVAHKDGVELMLMLGGNLLTFGKTSDAILWDPSHEKLTSGSLTTKATCAARMPSSKSWLMGDMNGQIILSDTESMPFARQTISLPVEERTIVVKKFNTNEIIREPFVNRESELIEASNLEPDFDREIALAEQAIEAARQSLSSAEASLKRLKAMQSSQR